MAQLVGARLRFGGARQPVAGLEGNKGGGGMRMVTAQLIEVAACVNPSRAWLEARAGRAEAVEQI